MIRGTPYSAVTAQRDPLPGQVAFNHDMVDDMADLPPVKPMGPEERQALKLVDVHYPAYLPA